METTNLNVRVDKNVKNDAERIFKDLGLNMSTAINMFLRASIREQGLPIDVKLNNNNYYELLEAMEEGRKIAKDPNTKSYSSINELIKALEEDDEI